MNPSEPTPTNRGTLPRLALQLALFCGLFYAIGRHEGWRIALAAVEVVACAALAARPTTRRQAEACACAGIVVLTLDFALDPPGASPTFALGLLAACGVSIVLWLAPFSRGHRGPRWITRFAVMATMLLLGTMLAELGSRGRFPRAAHGIVAEPGASLAAPYAKDPLLGHVQLPGFRGHFVHPEYQLERYDTNSDGFRDLEWPDPLPPGEKRVLCLGDSTMVGFGVLREEAIPALLQERLSTHAPVRVFNAGIAGYGPRRERILLERLLDRTRPQLVVVGFYDGNDLDDARTQFEVARKNGLHQLVLPSESSPRPALPEEPATPGTLFGRAYWSQYSQFYRRLETRLLRRLPGFGELAPDHAYRGLLPSCERAPDEAVAENFELTLQAFREMAELCVAHEAALVVVRIPARVQTEPRSFGRLLEEVGVAPIAYDRELPGRRVLEGCRALGIPTVDPSPELEHQGAGASPFYFHEGHPNRAGCAEVAKALATFISGKALL